MFVFLDTEFTDLVIQPRLLSVGLVTELHGGREFYGEVTDLERIRATCWFGLDTVLPQFGKVADAACTYEVLGARLSAFMGGLVARLPDGDFVDLAFGYPLDWELVDRAIQDARVTSWTSVRRRIRPVSVFQLTDFGLGKLAAKEYFKAQDLAPISRHHALCDARALRLAYEAATQAMAIA